MFEIEKDGTGLYQWAFKLKNGRVLARSPEGFKKQSAALRDIALLKEAAFHADTVAKL